MKKEEVIKELTEDEKNGNGEIIDKTDDYIQYLDYQTDAETQYRYEESCNDEYVRGLIHIGKKARDRGLEEDYIIDVLKKGFGDWYYDAICTLSGIIIPSDETEFKEMIDESIRTNDNADEYYDYGEESDVVGKMYFLHQMVFINEEKIESMSKELADEIFTEDEEYQTGIVMTILHEMRHLMLETHMFISEDQIPLSENAEDAVEEFAVKAYESLGSLKYWKEQNYE